MSVISLSRGTPLTPDEIRRLPPGVEPVSTGGPVIARAHVDLPASDLLGLAFELGRTFPDTVFDAVLDPEPAAAPRPSRPLDAPSGDNAASASAPSSSPPETDPWKLIQAGKDEEALAAFVGKTLDDPGRTAVRAMFTDTRPDRVVLGCRIATVTVWKAAATNFRSLLRHQHPDVREAALRGIGAVAGPSMGPGVKDLTKDPDARVRKAAEEVLKILGW